MYNVDTFKRCFEITLVILFTRIRIRIHHILWIRIPSIRIQITAIIDTSPECVAEANVPGAHPPEKDVAVPHRNFWPHFSRLSLKFWPRCSWRPFQIWLWPRWRRPRPPKEPYLACACICAVCK